jgi:hypothetical protein
MLLPLIESYWITFVYFISYDNRSHPQDEEHLFSKIQWLVESLYQEGQVKFYEACMLDSIKNAVQTYLARGILTKTVVSQRKSKKTTYYQLSAAIAKDNDKIIELYEQILFYLPYQPNMNLNRILAEIRKLTVSDIMVTDVVPLAKL